MEKSIPKSKARFVCMCLREKKKIKVYKKYKSPIQKGF